MKARVVAKANLKESSITVQTNHKTNLRTNNLLRANQTNQKAIHKTNPNQVSLIIQTNQNQILPTRTSNKHNLGILPANF